MIGSGQLYVLVHVAEEQKKDKWYDDMPKAFENIRG
jgi:hypothetical protein